MLCMSICSDARIHSHVLHHTHMHILSCRCTTIGHIDSYVMPIVFYNTTMFQQ